jgi:hypothetical protein
MTTKVEQLGAYGEQLIVNYLTRQGRPCKLSENKYDSVRDIICEGKNVEVKTKVPYILKWCFSLEADQERKCRNADELYFVIAPHHQRSFEWDGYIVKVNPKKFEIFERYIAKRDGAEMLLISIDQPACVPVEKVSDAEFTELMRLGSGKDL